MKTDAIIFKRLDQAFWAVWCILPVIIGIRLYFLFTYGAFNTAGTTSEETPIMDFSWPGIVLACCIISIGLVFYVSLFAFMHQLIRQFVHGNFFIDRTLQCMKRIAVIMLAWPFVKIIILQLLSYGLFLVGDIKEWTLEWHGIDLSLIATGLVVLALRLVIAHAIELHHDAEYTV